MSICWYGFPGSRDSKESACHAGLLPGSGRSPGEGNGNPLQYSSLEIPCTEEPGRLQSMWSQTVGHDWDTNTHTHTHTPAYTVWVLYHSNLCMSLPSAPAPTNASYEIYLSQCHNIMTYRTNSYPFMWMFLKWLQSTTTGSYIFPHFKQVLWIFSNFPCICHFLFVASSIFWQIKTCDISQNRPPRNFYQHHQYWVERYCYCI